MRIEVHLNCLGYFGFGGGWKLGRHSQEELAENEIQNVMGEIYCNQCSQAQVCWDFHRERCRGLVPDLMAAFEELLEEFDQDGQKAVVAYFERYDMAPPDIMLMMGNMEDGSLVGADKVPKTRGAFTLNYPFEGSPVGNVD